MLLHLLIQLRGGVFLVIRVCPLASRRWQQILNTSYADAQAFGPTSQNSEVNSPSLNSRPLQHFFSPRTQASDPSHAFFSGLLLPSGVPDMASDHTNNVYRRRVRPPAREENVDTTHNLALALDVILCVLRLIVFVFSLAEAIAQI